MSPNPTVDMVTSMKYTHSQYVKAWLLEKSKNGSPEFSTWKMEIKTKDNYNPLRHKN